MAFYETHRSLKSFDIHISEPWKNPGFQAHLHESFELLNVPKGSVCVRIEETEYHLRAGQQILILPNLIHEFKTESTEALGQLIIFSADYLPEIHREEANNIFHHPILQGCEPVFRELIQNKENHFLFRSHLYRIAASYENNPEITLSVRRNREISEKIFSYIEQNYREDIDENTLARTLGYHSRYLSRMINRNFGVSFRSLLNEYRIREAKKLLADPENSITRVYTLAGFNSQSAFNRNFRLITGITPREYRRNGKRNAP